MVICADLLDVLIVLDVTRFRFYSILKVRTPECRRVRDLSTARHTGFLAALSRNGLDSEQEINDAHVCSRHFMSDKPADLLDELNPDWLPTQNLGHHKFDSREQRRFF